MTKEIRKSLLEWFPFVGAGISMLLEDRYKLKKPKQKPHDLAKADVQDFILKCREVHIDFDGCDHAISIALNELERELLAACSDKSSRGDLKNAKKIAADTLCYLESVRDEMRLIDMNARVIVKGQVPKPEDLKEENRWGHKTVVWRCEYKKFIEGLRSEGMPEGAISEVVKRNAREEIFASRKRIEKLSVDYGDSNSATGYGRIKSVIIGIVSGIVSKISGTLSKKLVAWIGTPKKLGGRVKIGESVSGVIAGCPGWTTSVTRTREAAPKTVASCKGR